MIIAAFDFDGTLTNNDSFIDFLTFCFGRKKLFLSLLYLMPILLLYSFRLITNHVAKESIFSYFFQGMSEGDFNHLCKRYSGQIDKRIVKAAIDKLQDQKRTGAIVIIISASIQNWIKPWADQNGVDRVIGTEIEIVNNNLSGRFSSKNCYGQEKVHRLLKEFPDRKSYKLYAYGDSTGDRELLAFADSGHFKSFE